MRVGVGNIHGVDCKSCAFVAVVAQYASESDIWGKLAGLYER